MMTENIENNDAFASALASAASEKPPLAARPPKTKSSTTKKTILALGSVLLVFGLAAGVAILVSNLNNNNDAASSNVAADVSDEKLEAIPVDEEVPVEEEYGVFEEPPVVAEEPIVVEEEPVVVEKVEPTEWDEKDCPEVPIRARALQNSGGQASVQLFNRRVMKNHINNGGKKKPQQQLLRGGRSRRLQPEPESKSKSKKVCSMYTSDIRIHFIAYLNSLLKYITLLNSANHPNQKLLRLLLLKIRSHTKRNLNLKRRRLHPKLPKHPNQKEEELLILPQLMVQKRRRENQSLVRQMPCV